MLRVLKGGWRSSVTKWCIANNSGVTLELLPRLVYFYFARPFLANKFKILIGPQSK